MKPWVKYNIATVLFVGGVGGSIFYNQFLAPYINSEYVYVAAKPMDANTQIVPADWTRVRMAKNLVSPGAITNEAELASLYTSLPMSQNEQFTSLDTQPDPFTITPGTMDVPIPQSWIAAMSPTLRQGDYVDVVPIVTQTQQGVTTSVQLNTNGEGLDHILVLSVHTGQNTEVTNASPSGPQTVGARGNGSGTPSALDLKMTTSQAQTLETYVQQKYQLLIEGVSPNDTSSTATSTTSVPNNAPITPSNTSPASSIGSTGSAAAKSNGGK